MPGSVFLQQHETGTGQFRQVHRRQLNFQATTPGADKQGIQRFGGLINKCRQAFLLTQGADAAEHIAGATLHRHLVGHDSFLGAGGPGNALQAELGADRNDRHRQGVVVQADHQGFEHFSRVRAGFLGGLKAVALRRRIVFVFMKGVRYVGALGLLYSRCHGQS